MKKKQLYEAPSVETYDLVTGSMPLMSSKDFGNTGKAGGDLGLGETDQDSEYFYGTF